jgi:3'-5' exoribonuclease
MGASYVDSLISLIPGFPKEDRVNILHCMLAHHGKLEFGSPVEPKTAEAHIVYLADYANSRLQPFMAAEENSPRWGYNRMLGEFLQNPKNPGTAAGHSKKRRFRI